MAEPKRGRTAEPAEPAAGAEAGDAEAGIAALSFEQALAELEQIVKRLEGGQDSLEAAIAAYERGAALKRHCEAKLAEAEARVQLIVERTEGALETRPLRGE